MLEGKFRSIYRHRRFIVKSKDPKHCRISERDWESRACEKGRGRRPVKSNFRPLRRKSGGEKPSSEKRVMIGQGAKAHVELLAEGEQGRRGRTRQGEGIGVYWSGHRQKCRNSPVTETAGVGRFYSWREGKGRRERRTIFPKVRVGGYFLVRGQKVLEPWLERSKPCFREGGVGQNANYSAFIQLRNGRAA